MRFEFFTTDKINIIVFWVIPFCGLLHGYQLSGGTYCLQSIKMKAIATFFPEVRNNLLWQCRPASNPGYALVHTHNYMIPGYSQIQLMLL
jgi:hypothetical protein